MRKILALIIIGSLVTPLVGYAETAEEIQKSIDAKAAQIEALQREVNAYQQRVNQIQNQANTLQGTLNVMSADQKRLQSNLTLTTKKTEKTKLTIEQNEDAINDLGEGITKNTSALAETIRSLNRQDQQSLLELLASGESVSSFLGNIDQVIAVQSSLQGHVTSMQQAKANLSRAQVALQKSREELESLTINLKGQKKVIDNQVQEQKSLLDETKNKEEQYQQLLKERQQQIDALNAEIFEYESKLQFTLNPNTLPKVGTGVLSWPVEDVLITQRFGKTVDARRLYVSGSHSGVDFRASVGTAIYAVADGVVEGVGNTDLTCPKASFGKWVFIRHSNGLATAYGHLSVIVATEGQRVKRGDLIAYSGNTGHSTGPHLHLTVYASNGINGEEGARVADRPSAACKGKSYRMPIAPTSAYLDPLLYLPKTTNISFKDGKGSTSE